MNLALQTVRSCFQRLESYLNQFFNRLSANDEELCRVNQIKIIKWLKWEGRDMEKSMRDINESIKEGTGELERILERWPQKPKGAAARLLERYGEPDDYSRSHLVWYNTEDGWKRTVLSSEEIPHNFPAHHTDFLEQSINYKVPVHLYSRVAEFDGSIIVERTRGEISSRSAGTAMNFAAINLVYDIVNGRRSVMDAREEMTRIYREFQKGNIDPYAEAFQFELPDEDTGDLDVTTL